MKGSSFEAAFGSLDKTKTANRIRVVEDTRNDDNSVTNKALKMWQQIQKLPTISDTLSQKSKRNA